MATYTKNEELSSIHFLNDGNIAQELDSGIEINPIPSLGLLDEVNTKLQEQITSNDSDISDLQLSVESISDLLGDTITSCDNINTRIDDLDSTVNATKDEFVTSITEEGGKLISVKSSKVKDNNIDDETISESKIKNLSKDLQNLSANYVKKSGDNVSALTVDNDISINGGIKSKYLNVETNGDIKIGEGNDKHGSISINVENGISNVKINDKSISNYIDDAINELDVENTQITSGKTIRHIKEVDGKIVVGVDDITSADIPVIPQEKVSGLTNDYVKYDNFVSTLNTSSDNFFKDGSVSFEIKKEDGKHYLKLGNNKTSQYLSVNVDDFITEGIVKDVEVVAAGVPPEVYPAENGPYLKITWKLSDSTEESTTREKIQYVSIKNLIKVYKSTDSKGGLCVDDFSIYLNYGVVTERELFDPVNKYVTNLSNDIIPTLSSDVIESLNRNIRSIKFDGCIKHFKNGSTIKKMLEDNGEIGVDQQVRNNSIYRVQIEDSDLSDSQDDIILSAKFKTQEGLEFTNTDYLLIHNHDSSVEKIPLDNITKNDIIVVKTGVSNLDLVNESEIRENTDDFLSDSIDNEKLTRIAADNFLSNAIDHKIFLSSLTDEALSSGGKYSDLSVIKTTKDEYEKMVVEGNLSESAIYIISSDYIDAYGEVLCNLVMPTESGIDGYQGVGATKPYVDEKIYDESKARTSADGVISNYVNDVSAHISSLNTSNTLSSSSDISIITELTQSEGQIDIKARSLISSDVSGLTGFVNGAIDEKIQALDVENISAENKFIWAISETNGKVSALTRQISSSDISGKLDKDQIAGLTGDIDTLCTKIDNKVWIKNPTGKDLINGANSNLSVIKLTKDEYIKHIVDDDICESVLYIVSSDYIDAYGAPLCNLTMPISDELKYEGVAATKPYVDEQTQSTNTVISTLMVTLWSGLSGAYIQAKLSASDPTAQDKEPKNYYTVNDCVDALYGMTDYLYKILSDSI